MATPMAKLPAFCRVASKYALSCVRFFEEWGKAWVQRDGAKWAQGESKGDAGAYDCSRQGMRTLLISPGGQGSLQESSRCLR